MNPPPALGSRVLVVMEFRRRNGANTDGRPSAERAFVIEYQSLRCSIVTRRDEQFGRLDFSPATAHTVALDMEGIFWARGWDDPQTLLAAYMLHESEPRK